MRAIQLAVACVVVFVTTGQAQAGMIFSQTLRVQEERRVSSDNTTAPFDFVFSGLQPIDSSGSFTLDLTYENIDLDNTTVTGEFLSLIIGPGTTNLNLGEFQVTRNITNSWETSGMGQRVVKLSDIGGITNFTDPLTIRIQGSPEVEVREVEGNGYIDLTLSYETANTTVVPEPASIALWGLGSLGMGVIVRRRKRNPPAESAV